MKTSWALVTGASSGIGQQFAQRLADKGHGLVLVARRRERLDALAKRLEQERKVPVEVLVADLTRSEELAKVEARARQSDVDWVVNNAGFANYGPFVDVPVERLDATVSVHLTPLVHLSRAALPGMVARRRGTVVNVASLLALSATLPPNPMPYRAVYAASKAFMVAFTQALVGELAGTGVNLQVCLPGIVDTEFHDDLPAAVRDRLKSMSMPAADVVTAALSAASRGESVCIPGLEDPAMFERVSEAQRAVLGAGNIHGLATRYR